MTPTLIPLAAGAAPGTMLLVLELAAIIVAAKPAGELFERVLR